MAEGFKNAIVGQSGGPTSAINATLSGVIRACKSSNGFIERLYGMKNGIEGFLKEDFVDLFYFFDDKSKLISLENTPSSALGSCRLRLPNVEEDNEIYKKIFSIFEKYNIGYFFYVGGNDSMDTVLKLSDYALLNGYDIKIIGIPKTIDNDLEFTDHTPGYGSAAKYIAVITQEILRDCSVYTLRAVTIIEIMGRNAGWLTACASIPGSFGEKGVDYIYLPEVEFSNEKFLSDIKNALKKHPDVVVAVSEGVRYSNGAYVGKREQSGATDEFGHKYLAGTARVLSTLIEKEIGCKVRSVELNLPQRCSAHILSKTDILESIRIGESAVKLALDGKTAKVPVFIRKNGKYRIEISSVDVKEIANKEKLLPRSFINQEGNNVTQECIDYILPLIKGERKIKFKDGLPIHCIIK